jgi:outer membrane protein insertion porin family
MKRSLQTSLALALLFVGLSYADSFANQKVKKPVQTGSVTGTYKYAQEANRGERTESQLIERVIMRGNSRIPASTIKSWIGTRKGDSYSPEQLDRDVRALHDTGHFDDVKVYVEDGLRRGKIITFEVTERPIILEILYEGIDQAIEAEVLEEWHKQRVELSKGSEYDPVKVRRAAAIIRDVLVRRGNQQAKVNPMVERQTPTGVSIVFKVEE